MKLSTTALGPVLALAATPAAAQMGYGTPPTQPQQTAVQPIEGDKAQSQSQVHPSSGAMKAIVDLQTAVNSNNTAEIPAKLAAAQKVAKTKDDKYIIGQLQLKAALAAKDNAGMMAAVDSIATSGFIDTTKAAGLYDGLASNFYNAKQFDLAGAALEKALALTPNNTETLTMLGETRNAQGRKADAVSTFQRAIQLSQAAGQKPPETWYKRAVGLAYDAKLPVAVDVARQWLSAYPSADSWQNSIAIYRNTARPEPATAFDILRLARVTNSLSGDGDYHIYAFQAAEEANFGEAKSLMQEAISSGKVQAGDPIIVEIMGALKAKTVPTVAELAASEKAATAPTAFLHVGDRYYAAGNYQKAAELYRQAAAKGVDPSLANLRLGEALARNGDKAGATAAFNSVTGPRAEIAKFWLIYLNTHS